jgi:peptidoglycan/xylan/chitin deacetylase (PgdA/CDA1 family)
MQLRNFLFHRVTDERDTLWPPMTPQLFESIVRLLMKRFHVVPLEAFLANPAAFSNSAKKIATVLFDDGYKDNIEYAAPILQKYKCPASFYIVTGSIDNDTPTWTYQIDEALQQTKQKIIELPFDYVPEKFKVNELSGNRASREIKPWLKTLPNQRRTDAVNHILHQCNDVEPVKNKMMSWQEIRQLQQQGFHIGSHSHTHPMLASIETEADIRFELKHSAERIQQETGQMAKTISYPIGSYDQRVIRIAKECGYKWGLAVEQRFFQYNENELMAIPRVELYQEPFWKARLRINGIYGQVKNVWS